jgi:hypothetical protein
MSKKSNSSFWSDRFFGDSSITRNWNDTQKTSHDLYKLAASKRAIGNFVNIVTNKNIPVRFRSDNHSYTDGKTVVIGSNISEPKDFDVAVGLSLHEGSHIKLSNFELLKKLDSIIPDSCYGMGEDVGFDDFKVQQIIKDLWNVVEDRRIDDYIYSTAPGYRGYYQSMYNKYFNNNVVDTALESDKLTEENLNSYMFRIINIHNSKTRVNALKNLKEIYEVIGLGTINRLKTSEDAFAVALEVYKLVISAIEEEQNREEESQEEEMTSEEQSGEGTGGKGDNSEEGDESESGSDSDDDNEGGEEEDEDEESNGGSNGDDDSEDEDEETDGNDYDYEGDLEREKEIKKFSEALNEALEKAIEQQESFLRDEIEKESLSKVDSTEMDTIEESGVETTNVGNDMDPHGNYNNEGVTCIVAKKLTKSLLNSNDFPLTSIDYNGIASILYEDEVATGIKIGTKLGKKLQVRAESRTTVFNRQKNGKIDKRMISSLGFGNENVFYYNEVDQYNKANLHISIDASSSMNGRTWKDTLINVTALCRAVDMIEKLEIQVSFRATSTTGLPYIVMAYDSRADSFSKVREMFPCLRPRGTTPEGLCFEAIERNFIPSSNTIDSYFVNISDGEPYYSGPGFSYRGSDALKHTKEQVRKMKMLGIKVLSYFVSDDGSREHTNFSKMYGRDSRFIDVTNVGQITKTMNSMFLEK